jgi:hypothetical protein
MRITTSFERVAGDPAKIGVWVVTQLKEPDGIFVELPATSAMANGHVLLGKDSPPSLKVRNGLIALKRDSTNAFKIGTEGGRLVWVGPRATLRIDSPRVADAEYPDQGSSAEVYTSPNPLRYIELEMLGPLRSMKPGGKIERESVYSLFRRTRTHPEAEAKRVLKRVAE